MKKPTKQIVYLLVKVEDITKHPNITLIDIRGIDTFCSQQEAFVFTPEQLNEYTQSVIKQALETAAETQKEECVCKKETCVCSDKSNFIVKSITNTFEETYKKFEV